MQRRLVKDFAASIAAEIHRIRDLPTNFRNELTLLDIFTTEDFVVTQLQAELNRIITRNSAGIPDGQADYLIGEQEVSFKSLEYFINYLKKFEGIINGVHADREKQAAVKLAASGGSNNRPNAVSVESFHNTESSKKRITDSDYPSSPNSLLTRVNEMLATKLYECLVQEAPINADTGLYRLPIDFLYSGFPSQYPHVPDVKLSFSRFFTTECGRPLVILVSLDELRAKLTENPGDSVFLRHTGYSAEECKRFDNGSQPKLNESERIKLLQHSDEVFAYYNGIIKYVENETLETKNARLDALRAAVITKMNSANFQPGYRVGSEKAILDDDALAKLAEDKPSAKRLQANGFMKAFSITNVNELANMLKMVPLQYWEGFVNCFTYNVLCDLLLPKVKINNEFYPDYELLNMENTAKFRKLLELGQYNTFVEGRKVEVKFWDENSELHDRAVLMLYGMLLKLKRQTELDGNLLNKVTTILKFMEFLGTCVNPDPQSEKPCFKPLYCTNQFPTFLDLDGTSKTFLAHSENGRVKVLVDAGIARHNVKVGIAKPLSASLANEFDDFAVPDVYNDEQITADIQKMTDKCGRAEWISYLECWFSDERVLRLKSYLTLKSEQGKSSLTGFAFFDKQLDRLNTDPLVQLFESLSFYKSDAVIGQEAANDWNDAMLSFFVKLYMKIRENEEEKGKKEKLAAAQLLLEMLSLGDELNDVKSFIAKQPSDRLNQKEKEVMIACFTEGTTFNDRLTKLGLMAAKMRRPETYKPKAVVAKQVQSSGWGSWFGAK